MFGVVLLLCACVVLWLRARVKESRAHPLPPAVPNQLPIIGLAHEFLLSDFAGIWKLLKRVSDFCVKQGGVAYFNLCPDVYYVIADPEDALTLANTCLEKHYVYKFGEEWLGQGLLMLTGERFRRHRKLLSPVFSLPVMHGFLEVFNSQSKKLLKTMDTFIETDKIDLTSHLQKITLETSCLNTFGESENTQNSQYLEALEEYIKLLVNRIKKFWLHNNTLNNLLGETKKEAKVVKTLRAITDKVIQKQTSSSINGKTIDANFSSTTKDIGNRSFLNEILQQTNKDPLTDQEIRGELDTIIAGSFDTTYNFLITVLALIGSYPEVQQKMYEEIIGVVGPERDVEKEDLPKFVYTEAVIKESLRLMPPIGIIARSIDQDVKLKNYTLRAGTQGIISIYGINRHPSWGTDADEFRPERWLHAATLPKNHNTFAAFIFGKRSCPGKAYAMVSAKVTLAHVVRRYRLTADHTKMLLTFTIVLKSVAGHEIRLHRRNR